MRAGDRSTKEIATILGMSALALAGMCGLVDLLSRIEFGPQVGDIISFASAGRTPHDLDAQIAVRRSGNKTVCNLDVHLIQRDGGSLVIEGRGVNKDRPFHVHWAGPHSSAGAKDCGTAADVEIGSADIDLLALAAGGYGVTHKSLMPIWIGRPLAPP